MTSTSFTSLALQLVSQCAKVALGATQASSCGKKHNDIQALTLHETTSGAGKSYGATGAHIAQLLASDPEIRKVAGQIVGQALDVTINKYANGNQALVYGILDALYHLAHIAGALYCYSNSGTYGMPSSSSYVEELDDAVPPLQISGEALDTHDMYIAA